MKTFTFLIVFILVVGFQEAAFQQPSKPSQPSTQKSAAAVATSPMEGTVEYVGTLRGQSIMTGGRYVFLYGPADESAPMTGEAGVYQISDDTAKHTVTYCTDPERVGLVFMWTTESISGDTIAYVAMDEAGEVTDRGRSVKRH